MSVISQSESVSISSNMEEFESEASRLRSEAVSLKTQLDRGQIRMCRILKTVFDRKYYRDYNFGSFESWVQEELNFGYRTARYMVEVANAVERSNVSWDQVSDIGWTRLKLIASVLNQDNTEDWLDVARTHSTRDLEGVIREYKASLRAADSNSSSEQETVSIERELTIGHTISVAIRFLEDQHRTVMSAVSKAQEFNEGGSVADALEYICFDWYMRNADNPRQISMEAALHWVSETFGVRVYSEPDDDEVPS
jgi:hypothetical protein